jgi:hypothetical protein
MMSRHHYCKCLMNEIRFQWCIISSYMHMLHSPWTKLGINDALGFNRCTCYTLEDQYICDWIKWEDDVTHLPYRQRFISVSVSSHYSYIPSNFSTLHSSYNNRRGNSRNTNSTYFVRWVASTDFSRRIKYTTCLKNRKYTKSSCAWRKSWLCTCNKSSVKSPGHFANW